MYLSNELEGVQKRAMRIIFPLCSYNEALVESGLTKLSDRRQELVDKLFKNVLQNEQNKLHELLPARITCTLTSEIFGSLSQLLRRKGFVVILLPLTPLRLERFK